jgi:hypothetical protein
MAGAITVSGRARSMQVAVATTSNENKWSTRPKQMVVNIVVNALFVQTITFRECSYAPCDDMTAI